MATFGKGKKTAGKERSKAIKKAIISQIKTDMSRLATNEKESIQIDIATIKSRIKNVEYDTRKNEDNMIIKLKLIILKEDLINKQKQLDEYDK